MMISSSNRVSILLHLTKRMVLSGLKLRQFVVFAPVNEYLEPISEDIYNEIFSFSVMGSR